MPSVEHSNHPSNEVYLDNNATTKVLPVVVEAVNHAMQVCYGNPSSSHITGVKAKHILESTRGLARKVIGAASGEIIFTSGATEGIQMGIVSSLLTIKDQMNNNQLVTDDCYLLYGSTEHKAVPNTLEHWNKALGVNAKVMAIPVNDKGLLDEQFIEQYIGKTLLICTMAVNNETGVYQDLAKLERVIRTGNEDVFWLVDCVQALGKMNLNISDTSIDYAPFSGHKMYTPKGIGFMYIREGSPCIPIIAGGGQEGGSRSGTENIPGIAALHRVFSLLLDEQDDTFKSVAQLEAYRQQIADTLKAVFPGVVFNHDFDYSVPTTINFSVSGMFSKDLMDLFDAASIRVSSGSACSAKVTHSFVLDAMGADAWRSESAIRMSFGPASTQQEIDRACDALKSTIPALKHACLVMSDMHDDGSEGQLKTGFIELQYNNCCCWVYIDVDTRECIIIDPLPQLTARIEGWVICQKLTVKAVLDTHLHFDHEPYNRTFADIVMNHIPTDLQLTDDNGWPKAVDGQVTIAGKHLLPYVKVGALKVAAVHTPGHTQESMSFIFIDASDTIVLALLGDLVMPGALGRTNVPTSSPLAFYDSLKKLAEVLQPDTLIGSSHDYQHKFVTTMALESQGNALMASVLDNTISAMAFKDEKEKLDEKLVESTGGILCGVVEVDKVDVPYSLTSVQIGEFFEQHPQAVLLDVREAFECEMGDLVGQLNLSGLTTSDTQALNTIINVPLTKFADFVIHAEQYKDTPLLLICRTGTRSLLACQSLLRLGYQQVYNIRGGLALY